MADVGQGWRVDLYGLLLHPVEPRAVMLPGRAGWSLPAVHLEQRIWPEDVHGFNEAMRDELGSHVTVLHRPVTYTDRTARRQAAVYVLESHDPVTGTPPDGQWVDRADLVHGDFHPGNVAVRDGRLWFFDWTDVCVAHPFFDLVTFLEFDDEQYEPDRRARLLNAYLSVWADDESDKRVLEAWRLARILGALHQAVSYQHIVRTLEPAARPDLDWTHLFLRAILARGETEGPPP